MEILQSTLAHLLLLAPAISGSNLLRCELGEPGGDDVSSKVMRCSCEGDEENNTVSVRNRNRNKHELFTVTESHEIQNFFADFYQ